MSEPSAPRQRRAALALFALAVFFSMAFAPASSARMYRYLDDRGVMTVTDDLDNIPDKYRERAEASDEEDVSAADAPFMKTERQRQEEKKLSNRALSLLKGKGGRAALSTAAAVFLLVLVSRLTRRRALRYPACLLVFAALCVFLVFTFKPRETKRVFMKLYPAAKEQKAPFPEKGR